MYRARVLAFVCAGRVVIIYTRDWPLAPPTHLLVDKGVADVYVCRVAVCATVWVRGRAFASIRVCPRGAVPWGLAEEKCFGGSIWWPFRVAQAWGIVAMWACRWVEDWCFAWQAWGVVGYVAGNIVDVHFAWQAWDSGCMSALGKALGGGSAWQLWGIVRLDVAQRAFRVAGVGNGDQRGRAHVVLRDMRGESCT